MGILLPSLYNQQDTRWAKTLLGFNTDPQYNFYNYACLLSCLAMVSCYYGKNETPVTLNDKLKTLSPAGYAAGNGNYVYGSLERLFKDIDEVRVITPSLITDGQVAEIKTALDAGFPVMVQLDYNPKTVENDMHFVLLVGYNPADENDFTIIDPIGGQPKNLKAYLGWLKPSMRKTVEQYIIFKGKVPNNSTNCLLANTEDNRTLYKNLVHNSEEWIKTVSEYLGTDVDPKLTPFESVRSVVSGFKSRISDLINQLSSAKTELDKANQEVINQKEKLANTEDKCQRELNLKNAEITALNSTGKSIEKLEGQYKGTINDLEGQLREAQKQGGLKDLEIVELKKKVERAEESAKLKQPANIQFTFPSLKTIIELITRFFKK